MNVRYLEQCSNSVATIDPVNNYEIKFWATKLNEIDEGVSGYVVVKNYYKITKVNIFIY